MKQRALTLVLALACAAAACAPTLDWRELRPEGSGLLALFPCKPAGHARQLALAGVAVEMRLYACTAGGATYAVGFADIGQPQWVERALAELWAAAARNIDSNGSHAVVPLRIQGMTPNPQAGRQAFAGRLADGRRVEEQVAVFVRGTLVFQATMVGAQLDIDAIETFFGALRLPT
ncbi:MAG: hypothetical protein Q8L49_00025 [Burkholderiaceae bacterium]|nr:hypothetical protein [Burkholderiaceae bacterium]